VNQRETVPDRGLEFLGLRVHRTVFPLAVALIVLAVTAALLDPGGFNTEVARLRGGILQHFDSFIMIMGNLFVVLCVVLALSPLGRIRLGGPEAQPQFGFVSWFSMMFAAGMGVGLLYWGVAEPVAAYTGWSDTPLNVAPRTPAAAHAAMGSALFHWGLHPWAVYLVTALVVGYFAYNKGLPFAMSSALSPLIGHRHAGPIGQGVDVFTVVLTTFGLATSLGLGAMQSAAGMHVVLGTPDGLLMQGLFIAAVCLTAGYSVWTGIEVGILRLSNLNMALAVLLLAFCAVGMGVGAYLAGLVTALGDYARLILPLSDWRQRPDTDWRLDGVLLGLVVQLGTPGRSVHRARLARTHDPPDGGRGDGGTRCIRGVLVHGFRRWRHCPGDRRLGRARRRSAGRQHGDLPVPRAIAAVRRHLAPGGRVAGDLHRDFGRLGRAGGRQPGVERAHRHAAPAARALGIPDRTGGNDAAGAGWRRRPEGTAVGHDRHGTALPRLDGGADPRLHQGVAAGLPALSRPAVSP
jgi:BCCT, betaine/carnitine/choline family transporter